MTPETYMDTAIVKNDIQNKAGVLSLMCLEESERYHAYDDTDLLNATVIFSHFLMDKIYGVNKGVNIELQKELATSTGQAIRELIKASTGIDMHTVAKEL